MPKRHKNSNNSTSRWTRESCFEVHDGGKKHKSFFKKSITLILLAGVITFSFTLRPKLESVTTFIATNLKISIVHTTAALLLLIGLPTYFVIKSKGTVFVKRREHTTPFKTPFFLFAAFDSAK